MAGILDFLNKPLVPRGAIQGLQQAIDPGTTDSPVEGAIRGFGAGALEGLRSLTSPLSIAGMASPFLRAGRAAGPLVRGASALEEASEIAGAAPKLSRVTTIPGTPRYPSKGEADALIGQLRDNLSQIPAGRGAIPSASRLAADAGRQGFSQALHQATDQAVGSTFGEYTANQGQEDPLLMDLRERFRNLIR